MTGIRSLQRLATCERILATARKLFLASSFEQVGVREIAAEAGVATGTVIAAFGSKGDLLNAIIVEDLRKQLPLMENAVATCETTVDRLLAAGNASVTYHSNQIAIVRASMAGAWTHTDDAENRVRAAIKPIFTFIILELQRGIQRGEVRVGVDLRLAAQMLFETMINTYRNPIYGDCNIHELRSVLKERLSLMLGAFCIVQGDQDAAFHKSMTNSGVAA